MTHLLELLPLSFGPFLFFSTLLLLAGDLNKANILYTIQAYYKQHLQDIYCKYGEARPRIKVAKVLADLESEVMAGCSEVHKI